MHSKKATCSCGKRVLIYKDVMPQISPCLRILYELLKTKA
jgi:hypothetical protein